MPTRDQMDAVIRRIETLEDDRFDLDGEMMRPAEKDIPDSVSWDGLKYEQQLDVLSTSVDWSGFTVEEQVEVSLRVVDREPSFEWMGDIVASDQWKVDQELFAELREDERAARVRDFGEADAATYPARMAEADRLIERELGPVTDSPVLPPAEMDQLLADIEASWGPASGESRRGEGSRAEPTLEDLVERVSRAQPPGMDRDRGMDR